MKATVLFDHQIFSLQRYGGISRYHGTLLEYLSQHSKIAPKLPISASENIFLPERYLSLWSSWREKLFKKEEVMKRYARNQRLSEAHLKRGHYDIFHPTYYDPYFVELVKKPVVVTVHDMIYERFPEYFPPDDPTPAHKKITISRADHIIAISETTKRDLQQLLGIPDEKISVIHHGLYTAYGRQGQPAPQRRPVTHPYLLFVGNRGGYKNFDRFVTAMGSIMHQRSELHLVCIGGDEFSATEQELFERLGITPRVHQKVVSDLQLAEYYRFAEVFIFPSLYEGFGLPVLEAFSCNCPVALSRNSSLPEVGGKAAVYFDPQSIDEMTEVVQAVLNDRKLRADLVKKGKETLFRFDAKTCFQKTLKVYQQLAE